MNPMQMLQNFLTKGLSPQKIVEQMTGKNLMVDILLKLAIAVFNYVV